MIKERLKLLRQGLIEPVLIKKKENLLYLTGRSFMHGYLLVKPRKGAESDAERRGKKLSVVFLGDGLEKMDGVHSDFLKNVGMYVPKNRTLEVFGEITYAEVKYIKSRNPDLRLKVIVKRDPVDYLRMIKEPQEILLVKKSMQIVERVFKLVRSEIKKPGMTEIRLAEFIKQAGLKLGAEDTSFPPIVASGANAAVPHHVPSNKKLKAGESIILDFGFSAGGGSASGGKYPNYCSDFTRTVFLKKAPPKLEMVYNQVEKAYAQSIDFVGTGRGQSLRAGEVYQKSVSVLAEKRLEKYFIHSLGHGTGLEIHELPNLSPNSKDILQNGMVFSIEPGVYIPKLGGVRIEDLVYLEGKGIKKFIAVPTELKYNIL